MQPTPSQLLTTVAEALNMHPAIFRSKERFKNYAELRIIGALVLRSRRVTYVEIGALFDKHHTTIMSAVSTGKGYLAMYDEDFTAKCTIVQKAIKAKHNIYINF